MLNKFYLWFINYLLYPYVLGFYSENNGGSFVVTTESRTEMRGLGARKWQNWTNTPSYPRIFNEYLEIADSSCLDFSVFLKILKAERIHSPIKAFYISLLCRPYLLALYGDPQGQYHYCLVKNDPTWDHEQTGVFIFPGTQFDLYDTVPKSEFGRHFVPMNGGSRGWLADLPFKDTLTAIRDAKKRLLESK